MSRYRIAPITRALQRWIQSIPNPVEAPAPVRRAPQPAPQVDFRLSPLAQRRSVSMSMAGRTGVLPKVALHPPVGKALVHPLAKPQLQPLPQAQPRHSLGSQVWSQRNEWNKALGPAWVGSLDRHPTPLLEARRLALQKAVDAQLKAIEANNAVPGASTFGQAELLQELQQRLDEAKRIKSTLDQRKAPAAPLGMEVWNHAQAHVVPPAPQPLRQMSKTALRQRRDVLDLAIKGHDISSRTFEKVHGHREFGHEILEKRMAGYRAEIGRIDRLQAQRARRK